MKNWMEKNLGRRLLAMVLCLSMVLSMAPVPSFAEGCTHHLEHTAECGYVAEVASQPCGHEHDAACGYQEAAPCTHSCADGTCGYREAVQCNHVCGDGNCGYAPAVSCNHVHTEACGENGESCAHFCGDGTCSYFAGAGCDHSHNAICGHQEASPCTHSCADGTCGYREARDCTHQHDESCGYREAVTGSPCNFVCEICNQTKEQPEDTQNPEDTKNPEDTQNPEDTKNPEDTQNPEDQEQGGDVTESCTCKKKCESENATESCLVCAADYTKCEGKEITLCAHEKNQEECILCPVQALIDALPTVEELTAETEAQAREQLATVKAAVEALTAEEQALLILDKYTALTEYFAALDEAATEPTEPEPIVVTDWQWDYDEYIDKASGCMVLPITSEEFAAYLSDEETYQVIQAMLPGAVLFGEEPLTLEPWTYEPAPEGTPAVEIEGESYYPEGFFKTTLPEGYVLEDETNVLSLTLVLIPPVDEENTPEVYDTKSDIYFMAWNGSGLTTAICAIATIVTGSDTSWGTAGETTWYVVKDTGLTIGSRITVSGDVHLILADGCKFTVNGGIGVSANNSLTIYGQSAGTGELNVTGVASENGGIGGSSGSNNSSCGNITIHGGKVTAAGNGGAGIGGCKNGRGGTITIHGGTIIATGGDYAAGIGSGSSDSTGSTITITDGKITANGGTSSAGIGGSDHSKECNITISGGYIEAYGGNSGAGIGGGYCGSVGTITISGGTVKANGSTSGAGIGGGSHSASGKIIISGGDIEATGSTGAAGIGGSGGIDGWSGSSANVTISGGKVTANGGSNGAGIGGGDGGAGGEIIISGGEITANGSGAAAGIGGGSGGSGGNIAISSGKVTAKVTANGGNGGAGIGGGGNNDKDNSITGGEISITGGTVTATGNGNAAGIGGGINGSGGKITISGGTVTANGAYKAAGIGGGWKASGGTIIINGGTVTANGGSNAAGIGDGYNGSGGTFATGENGIAVIYTSSISDQSGKTGNSWRGIIFEGSDGKVYGTSVTPVGDFEIPANKNLLIPEGASLVISVITVTNCGKVYVNGGTLEGTIPGDVYYPLTLNNCTADGDVVIYPAEAGVTYGKQGGAITLTAGEGLTTVAWKTSVDGVIVMNNTFTMPAGALTITAEECVAIVESRTGITFNYSDFKEAFASYFLHESTLTLVQDVTCTENLTTDEYFTLDLNGHKLDMSGCSITIAGSVTATWLTIQGSAEGSVLTADSLTVGSRVEEDNQGVGGGGRLTIQGGQIKARIIVEDGSNAYISGGEFVNPSSNKNLTDLLPKDSGSYTHWYYSTRTPGAETGYDYSNPVLKSQLGTSYNTTLYVGPHSHTGELTKVTETEHTYTCSVCGGVNEEKHTTDEAGFCTICGAGMASYVNANGVPQYPVLCYRVTADYLASCKYKLEPGWYVVTDPDLTIGTASGKQRIAVNGNVNLILADGCSFTVSDGIQVGSGKSLTIWGQKGGDGELVCSSNDHDAGIGGTKNGACGTVIINGGDITSTGGGNSAGIGGSGNTGAGKVDGTIEIHGGTVHANGGEYAPGIGSSPMASGGKTILITGGSVVARGGYNAAGIGGGGSSDGGTVRITGGTVTAFGNYAPGIGGGNKYYSGNNPFGNGANVTISNAVVIANGIGGVNGRGSFFVTGNSVVVSDYIKDKTNEANWSGIIIENSNGQVYGSVTPAQDFEIPAGKNLLIPAGTSLTIPEGITVTNSGKVYMTGGTINGEGRLTNTETGGVYYPLTLTNCTAEGDVVTYPEGGTVYGKFGGTVTLTGTNVPEGKMVSGWTFDEANANITVTGSSFTMPDKAVAVTAVFGDILASVTVGETVTNYDDFQKAFDAANATADSTLKLLANVNDVPALTVNGNFTLDLNGQTLTSNAETPITVVSKSKLTVIDSNTETTAVGSITSTVTNQVHKPEIDILAGGTFDFRSGEIKMIISNQGILSIYDPAKVTVASPKTAVKNYGYTTIYGGTLTGMICVETNDRNLTIKGGTFNALYNDYNSTNSSYCVNRLGGNVTVEGGTFNSEKKDRIYTFNSNMGKTVQGGSFPNGVTVENGTPLSVLKSGFAFFNGETPVDGSKNFETAATVIAHPDHTFTYAQIEGDKHDFQHTATCGCGYSEDQNHVFVEGEVDYNGFCKDCGAYQPATLNGDIYEISNAGQLYWFADYVNNSTEPEASSARGQLQKDITIPTKEGEPKRAWTPIGTESNSYCGVFNGNGHSISGLYFAGEVSYASLFGWVGPEGRIENLTIKSVEYDVSVSTSKIAGICGVLDGGQITNCTNAAVISCHPSHDNAAGICYQNNGTISGCTNAGEILTGDSAAAGGICVINNGTISGCTNTGEIHTGDSATAGGICVTNNRSISECTNIGTIQGGSAGGICFENGSHDNRSSSIENCANRVRINGSGIAGGICARNFGTVSYSYHFGILNGGPIVDEMQSDGGRCSNCYYLADWETDGIDGTTAKTAAQFRSGEVAYLLRDNPSSNAASWGQTLTGESKQDYPVLNGVQVYRHNSFCPVYSNIPEGTGDAHTPSEHDSKICGVCGAALEARVTVGGTDTYYTSLKDAFTAANDKTATITLLRDAKIGEDETLEISGGEVTFKSAVNFDAAEEGSASYTITTAEDVGNAIEVNGGTFNFDSGTLQTSGNRQGIFVLGGTLNFRGGTISNKTGASIFIGDSGQANISDGTVQTVNADSYVYISGGSIEDLSATYEQMTSLSGGSFRKIATHYGKVSDLLAEEHAYFCDGSWVDATNGEDAGTLSGNIQVRPIPVKIESQPRESTSFTYGDCPEENKNLTVTASGNSISYQWYRNGDAVESGTNSEINVSGLKPGSYQFYCRLTCDGYVLKSDTVTVTVAKAVVTPPTIESKVYNGSAQKADVPYTGLYTVTENNGGINADNYDVVLELLFPEKYKWADSEDAQKTIKFEITQAKNNWTTEPAIKDWTYGETTSITKGSAKFGTVTVEYKVKDAADTTYSEAVPTNAGSYTARFTVAGTDNYAGISEVVKDFTISPKPITVTITPGSWTYGDTGIGATAKINEKLVGDDQVPVTLTYTGTANDGTGYNNSTTAPTHAGTYTVTASIRDSNYKLTGTTTATFVVAKATVTTPDDVSKPFNEYTQTSGISETTLYTVDETGHLNPGTYDVYLHLKDSKNYQWDERGGIVKFTIKKAPNAWMEEPQDIEWTYGGTPNFVNAMYGSCTVEYSTDGGQSYSTDVPTDVGTYKYRITASDPAGNYETLVEERTATIVERELTLTWDKTTTFTYDGKNHQPTAQVSNVVEGDEITVTITGGQTNASATDYTATASFEATKGKRDNYTLPTNTTCSFTISPRELEATWGDTSFFYNGEKQKPTATANVVEGEHITLVVSGEQKTVGNYTATVSGFTAGEGTKQSNYCLPTEDITTSFSITQRELTVASADVTARAYNGSAEVEISAIKLKDVVDGENVTVSTVGVTGTLESANAGTYDKVTLSGNLTLEGSDAGNYTLTQPTSAVSCSVTISKKELTFVGVTADNKVYDGDKSASIATTLDGVLENDELFVIASGDFDTPDVGTGKTVTTTGFELLGDDAGNYKLPENQQMLNTTANITPKELTVTNVKVADKQYDGKNTATIAGTPTLDGVVENDDVTLVNGTPIFKTVEVGKGIGIEFTTGFSLTGKAKDNYTLTNPKPTGITGSIVNNYDPAAGTDYTTNAANENDWLNESFVVTAKDGFALSRTNTAEGTWSNELTVDEEGEGPLTFYVRNTETGAISKQATANYKVDKTQPTGTISFDNTNVTESSPVAVYKNKNVAVTIKGNDALSQVSGVSYLVSDREMKEAALKDADSWNADSTFTITAEDGATKYVYAKVVDNAGNVTYLRANYIVFDTTAPSITGVENGKTYYTTQTATITDTYLDSVTVNGSEVAYPIYMPGNREFTYRIVVTDKAGNATTVTVYMKTLASLTEEVKNVDGTTVKKADKENLEAAKKQLEDQPTSATEEEKGTINKLLKPINEALTALKNVEAVEKTIQELPDSIQIDDEDPADENAIKAAREAYNKLTDHEKTLADISKLTRLESDLVAYKIISGNGSIWNMGSGKDQTFTANGPIRKFQKVELDGEKLDKANYQVVKGSTIVTLNAAFMQTLAEGSHTLAVFYTDGQTEEAKFEVKRSLNYLDLTEEPAFQGRTEVFVDGVSYPIEENGDSYVNLPETGDLLTLYTYRTGAGDYGDYPTGMEVYRIHRSASGTTVTHIPELSNLLQYSGCSIRVTGNRGIRMITSLDQGKKAALTGAGLAGFTLEEYGTVVTWASDLVDGDLNLNTGKHNFAYKRGVADPVFGTNGSLTQYTNVLVGFSLEECGKDITMRPYIVLRAADGNQYTLYGGTVTRSISYIAWQNRDTYKSGTSAYDYVHELMGLYNAA